VSIKITGTRELFQMLRKVEKELLPKLVEPVNAATREAFALSQAQVPTDDGELRASGSTTAAYVDERNKFVAAQIHYTAPHAPYVHEGVHGKSKGRPNRFLRKAALRMKRGYLEALQATLKRVLDRHQK
jgi:hypothetical protein